MRTNTTKAKLNEGKAVFGAIISENSPGVVELMGALGYDFVFLDCEHGGIDLSAVEHLVRAAEVFNITPIARVPDRTPETILRHLDRGVQGIIVPHVNTAEEAASVVKAARYFPEGMRGSAGGRAHDYNIGVGRLESASWINSQLLVIPMVEEVEAIENLDSILSVPGVDVIHVAANDLAQSMGNPDPAEVRRTMIDVVKRVTAAGKHVGVGGSSPSDTAGVADFIRQGATFVTIQAFGLLRVGAESFRNGVQANLDAAKTAS